MIVADPAACTKDAVRGIVLGADYFDHADCRAGSMVEIKKRASCRSYLSGNSAWRLACEWYARHAKKA
jgi:hypothetical protein